MFCKSLKVKYDFKRYSLIGRAAVSKTVDVGSNPTIFEIFFKLLISLFVVVCWVDGGVGQSRRIANAVIAYKSFVGSNPTRPYFIFL